MYFVHLMLIFFTSGMAAADNFASEPANAQKSEERFWWRVASIFLKLPLEKWRYLKQDLIERGTCR